MRKFIKTLTLAIIFTQTIFITSAMACTRALWTNSQGTYVGRTMDWDGDMRADLLVYPRGLSQIGAPAKNALEWVSKYGSLVSSASDSLTTDGINEKGLAAHLLWLNESNYGPRNDNLPGLSVTMWAQFYLDNFATVAEAISYTKETPFQVLPFVIPPNTTINIHLVLEDASGDSAIIEYLDGQMQIYHDTNYKVVTNSPSYDQQLTNLRHYRGFGGNKLLPGTNDSFDRFVRAAFYVTHLPEPSSTQEAVSEIFSVINNAAAPFGVASSDRPVISMTIWRSVADLTHHVYYYQPTSSMGLMWASLDKFDLREGAPQMKLDLTANGNLAGDVSGMFKPA